ncbi:MAG: aspartate/glutamate racemase family protein [Kineosporiaceae bacterium]
MRILVINPNTNAAMTAEILAAARAAASPGTEVLAATAPFGVDGVDTQFESLLSAAAVMDVVATWQGPPLDAIVLAGFGEHGREGVQELVDVPVLDIAECSAQVAMMLGRRYGVVTTLARSAAAIEDRLLLAGLLARCSGVRSTGMTTAETDADPRAATAAVVEQARRAVTEDGAEVICLGCGGMAGITQAVADALGVPVVDGVSAGVQLAQALVGLGLKTSKVGVAAPPEDRPVRGWPLTRHLDLPPADTPPGDTPPAFEEPR